MFVSPLCADQGSLLEGNMLARRETRLGVKDEWAHRVGSAFYP